MDLARSEDRIYQLPPRAIEEIDANVRHLNGRSESGS
jgi:hypothetical protein